MKEVCVLTVAAKETYHMAKETYHMAKRDLSYGKRDLSYGKRALSYGKRPDLRWNGEGMCLDYCCAADVGPAQT